MPLELKSIENDPQPFGLTNVNYFEIIMCVGDVDYIKNIHTHINIYICLKKNIYINTILYPN